MKKIITVGVAMLLTLTFLGSICVGDTPKEITKTPLPLETYKVGGLCKFMLCGEPDNETKLPREPGCYRKLLRLKDTAWTLCCISACPFNKRQQGFCCICEGNQFIGTVDVKLFFGSICVKYTQHDTLKYAMCGWAFGVTYIGDCP